MGFSIVALIVRTYCSCERLADSESIWLILKCVTLLLILILCKVKPCMEEFTVFTKIVLALEWLLLSVVITVFLRYLNYVLVLFYEIVVLKLF
jgi:hypothetical protein